MKWIEMTVFTTEQGLDAVAARFDMLGIQQVMIEQGRESIEAFLKETAKYWDYADTDELVAGEEPCVKAYLADAGENVELVHLAEASFDALRKTDVGIDLGSLRFVVRLADDEDWANNWKAYYKPLKIGSRLLVRPSWETLADAEGRTVLSLDPGMAFGTGSHHTTRMCLEYLEKIVKTAMRCLILDAAAAFFPLPAFCWAQRPRLLWTSTRSRKRLLMKTRNSTELGVTAMKCALEMCSRMLRCARGLRPGNTR